MTTMQPREILDLTGALARERARLESRQCRCAEREAAGKPVPCAACRVAAFKRMNNSGSSEPGTWSASLGERSGTRDV